MGSRSLEVLSRRLKKMKRAEYGFVYCDWDLIEILFNTD